MISNNLQIERKAATVKLIEKILSEENLNEAIKKVKSNKGASGI